MKNYRQISGGERHSIGRRRWQLRGLLAVLLVCPALVRACDTPVFHYALTLWPADPYELMVVHEGDDLAKQTIDKWYNSEQTPANLIVRETGPDNAGDAISAILKQAPPTSLPWLIVRAPVRNETRAITWMGPLDENSATAWVDSPVRRQIVAHLKEGSAGVWILLEGGDRAADDAAYECLVNELHRLERVLVLTNPVQDAPIEKPTFVTMRLARDAPQEQPLVTMLLHSEPDLHEYRGQPMVFPVFGRGLVLYALIGRGINNDNIDTAASFITGECSCEVKSENPGLELLLSADWDELQPGNLADFQVRAAQAEVLLSDMRGIPHSSIHDTTPAKVDAPPTHSLLKMATVPIAVAGVLVLVLLCSLIMYSRAQRRRS